MKHFKDKIAIVTGGGSGIGKALCEELGRRGAVTVAADINAEAAQQVSSAITASGGVSQSAHLDVTQAAEVQALVQDTASKYGRLDFMFNNAGISLAGDVRDMTLDHWRRIVDVNLWGVIYGTTAAYSLMANQGFGHIINTSSTAGLIPFPGTTAYSTTKHAVVGLSTCLRSEAADLGVKVSVVCPGYVKTPIYDTMTVLKADRRDAVAKIPAKMKIDGTKAARLILQGVARNRAIIVFPLDVRIGWWIQRLHPGFIMSYVGRRAIRDFRSLRSEP